MNVVKSSQMPFERSPDGLIKHIVNEKMDTKECCIDIYMQFLPPGKASGKHRHLSEEVFYVVEGIGLRPPLGRALRLQGRVSSGNGRPSPSASNGARATSSTSRPTAFTSISTPTPTNEARIVVINSRIIKPMGFDWFEQLENAEGY